MCVCIRVKPVGRHTLCIMQVKGVDLKAQDGSIQVPTRLCRLEQHDLKMLWLTTGSELAIMRVYVYAYQCYYVLLSLIVTTTTTIITTPAAAAQLLLLLLLRLLLLLLLLLLPPLPLVLLTSTNTSTPSTP